MVKKLLKSPLFLVPLVPKMVTVLTCAITINTIIFRTNINAAQYIAQDLHQYHIENILPALNATIDRNCYRLSGPLQIDVNSEDWIDTLVNLHYSNVRTRNAAQNRINNNNIGEWTYKYPGHLKVNESMEAMKRLIKMVLKTPDVQWTVNDDSAFLGAVFFEFARALSKKYADFLKTYSLEPFLDYDKYFVNDTFNRTLAKHYKLNLTAEAKQRLFEDLCYYITDFKMLDLLRTVFLCSYSPNISDYEPLSRWGRQRLHKIEYDEKHLILTYKAQEGLFKEHAEFVKSGYRADIPPTKIIEFNPIGLPTAIRETHNQAFIGERVVQRRYTVPWAYSRQYMSARQRALENEVYAGANPLKTKLETPDAIKQKRLAAKAEFIKQYMAQHNLLLSMQIGHRKGDPDKFKEAKKELLYFGFYSAYNGINLQDIRLETLKGAIQDYIQQTRIINVDKIYDYFGGYTPENVDWELFERGAGNYVLTKLPKFKAAFEEYQQWLRTMIIEEINGAKSLSGRK